MMFTGSPAISSAFLPTVFGFWRMIHFLNRAFGNHLKSFHQHLVLLVVNLQSSGIIAWPVKGTIHLHSFLPDGFDNLESEPSRSADGTASQLNFLDYYLKQERRAKGTRYLAFTLYQPTCAFIIIHDRFLLLS